jgi:ubiquitin C-terminal hydrolase
MASVHSVGLNNLGNTCFLNAVLQALLRCAPLVKYLTADPTRTPATRPESKKAPMVAAMQTFLLESQASKASYSPTGFIQTMLGVIRTCDDDWYRPRQQGDAAECVQYILDCLHDALYRSVRITFHGTPSTREEESHMKALQSWASFFAKEYSPIVEHFQGQSQICVECQTCKHVSERYEPWMMIKAPIPGGDKEGSEVPTFDHCLNAAYQTEQIDGYACETCKSPQPALIRTRISKFPNILILTFKRFTNSGAKIRGQIDWDLDAMNLRPWAAFSKCPFSDHSSPVYRTFAVLEHNGSSRGGHYRMYARDDGVWYEYDDESVRTVDRVITPDSYVVFAIPST